LLNRLARREAAIVSPYAGTTRDVIEVHLDLGGYPMTLLDTAGIRDTADPVEMEGVRRARERAAGADLVLWVTDASEGDVAPEPDLVGQGNGVPVWRIRNKADLVRSMDAEMLRTMTGAGGTGAMASAGSAVSAPGDAGPEGKAGARPPATSDQKNESMTTAFAGANSKVKAGTYSNEYKFLSYEKSEFILSAGTGSGLDSLVRALTDFAASRLSGAEQALVTRARHRQVLAAVQQLLSEALTATAGREELLAEQLRLSAMELGRLAGRVDVEDVLDVIFRDFCIGK
jgi:tRNA modification GTPase